MYKLLPILLFAFLIAEEKSAPLIIQSDSLDFIWAEEYLDLGIKEFKKQVANIINEDKFLINVDRKVYDVMRVDKSYHEMLDSLLNEMKNNYPQKNRMTSKSMRFGEGYWRLEVYAINVEVNVDKSIELDYSIKRTILDIINNVISVAQNFDMEDIIFNSVDINKLKNKNKQLSLNRDDIYDDSWAVIIGIDKYKYSDQLNYAVKDAEAVKDMLISKFDYPEENIRYLVDEEATLSNIKLNLGEVATSAEENDRILVFYSGHGETIKGVNGTEKGYIIPYEGRQNKAYATGLAMDEILTTSMLSQSKHMLFLMDACYSGLMTENVKGLAKPQEEGYLSKVANEKARQIITAGGRDEQVIERDEWQHSAFTKNLLEGLETWEADYNKDGCITADELSTYLREHVTEDSDFQQTPQDGRFKNSGGGEFVFFGRGDYQTAADVSLINEKDDENLKEELFNSYENDEDLIRDFKSHKRQKINALFAKSPPNTFHSFSFSSFQKNIFMNDGNKEATLSFVFNEPHNIFPIEFSRCMFQNCYALVDSVLFSIGIGVKNFLDLKRHGLYWGYNVSLQTAFNNHHNKEQIGLVSTFKNMGNVGILPALEFGYRLKWITSNWFIQLKEKKRKMRLYFITAKIHLYPIRDRIFNLPINEFYKGFQLSSSLSIGRPTKWWKTHLNYSIDQSLTKTKTLGEVFQNTALDNYVRSIQIENSEIITRPWSFSGFVMPNGNWNLIEISRDFRLSNKFAAFTFLGYPINYGVGMEFQKSYNDDGEIFGFSFGRNKYGFNSNTQYIAFQNRLYRSNYFFIVGLSISNISVRKLFNDNNIVENTPEYFGRLWLPMLIFGLKIRY